MKPMLATLGTLPAGPGWASEFKWDGVRAVTYVRGGAVNVVTRNDLDVTSHYPELADVAGLAGRREVVVDGEIVALDNRGVPEFARLGNRIHVRAPTAPLLRTVGVQYYVFDVLAVDGEPTVGWPYARRRELLDELGLDGGAVRTPAAFVGAEPAAAYDSAVEAGLEGVVCKRLDSPYRPGRRSPDWVKVPIAQTQEVIVVGWLPGAGRRAGMIGSLLTAAYDADGTLAYTGKVGTGFTDAALRQLEQRLRPLARATSPADGVPRAEARHARWVTPKLVGEVAFRTWTPDRRLRHPSWRGLRIDKTPSDARLPE
ncbi:hypothetical protein GCM10010123_19350 [Pilimelia anulata]|uniref:DNA ligase (ATP) n=1 Tax=Pilimelia anulata TaxID=53371 RepID=A0A8J3B4U2_9ACTN|nr:hypothetical protein GCM10010123_19350 [Pilimelia anulata]